MASTLKASALVFMFFVSLFSGGELRQAIPQDEMRTHFIKCKVVKCFTNFKVPNNTDKVLTLPGSLTIQSNSVAVKNSKR
jgi:hypothetical protein